MSLPPLTIPGLSPEGLAAESVRNLGAVINTGAVTYDVDFPQYGRWLWVNLTGAVSYVKWDGTTETLSNVVAGVWHPIAAKSINSAGTTVAAANIRWGN